MLTKKSLMFRVLITLLLLTTFAGIFAALSVIGISVAPIMAIIGAATFVIAFALQGTLSNFFSSIMIMLYHSFDVKDLIEVAGVTGNVKSTTLVSTTIMTKHLPLILWVFPLSLSGLVSADEVVLKNGSRLVGEVLKKEGSVLIFKTPFAGSLKINWKNVVELKTDKPVKLMLDDGSIQMSNGLRNEGDTIEFIHADNNSQVKTIKQSEMAYINPDPWRLGEGYKISGNTNVSLKSQRGNTDKDEFDLDGRITFRGKYDRLKIMGEYENDKSNKKQSSYNWLLLGKYDYFLNDKTYVGGSIFFEKDEFADLDLRETYGAYLGHQYFESKAINLSVEAGLAQVFENFFEAEDGDFTAGTWGITYDQYFFDEFVQLYHRQLGRVNVSETDKFIFKSWTGLRFPLAFGFSVSGEVEADYDNQPASDVEKEDTTYRFKVGYDY